MAKYGLIGKSLGHSFSKTFFTYKFEKENRKDSYHNFELGAIEEFPKLITKNPDLKGLNVTIPYKEAILPFLDRIDKEAEQIGEKAAFDRADRDPLPVLGRGSPKGVVGVQGRYSSLLLIHLSQAQCVDTVTPLRPEARLRC